MHHLPKESPSRKQSSPRRNQSAKSFSSSKSSHRKQSSSETNLESQKQCKGFTHISFRTVTWKLLKESSSWKRRKKFASWKRRKKKWFPVKSSKFVEASRSSGLREKAAWKKRRKKRIGTKSCLFFYIFDWKPGGPGEVVFLRGQECNDAKLQHFYM